MNNQEKEYHKTILFTKNLQIIFCMIMRNMNKTIFWILLSVYLFCINIRRRGYLFYMIFAIDNYIMIPYYLLIYIKLCKKSIYSIVKNSSFS